MSNFNLLVLIIGYRARSAGVACGTGRLINNIDNQALPIGTFYESFMSDNRFNNGVFCYLQIANLANKLNL